MHILTLNCWGGHEFAPLMQFVETYAPTVDAWCLQEISLGTVAEEGEGLRYNLLDEFLKRLPAVSVFRYPSPLTEFRGSPLRHDTNVGLATLVNQNLQPRFVARTALYDAQSKHATAYPQRTGTGHLLVVETSDENGNRLLIGNVHGLWTPQGKGDVPDRLEQSHRLTSFARVQTSPVILAGDFNLELDCRSTRVLEEVPMRNLVREYGISTTRTPLYNGKSPHADNVFVTAQVVVKTLRVLSEVVSDHAALLFEAEAEA